jgi:hypothetical protein
MNCKITAFGYYLVHRRDSIGMPGIKHQNLQYKFGYIVACVHLIYAIGVADLDSHINEGCYYGDCTHDLCNIGP